MSLPRNTQETGVNKFKIQPKYIVHSIGVFIYIVAFLLTPTFLKTSFSCNMDLYNFW